MQTVTESSFHHLGVRTDKRGGGGGGGEGGKIVLSTSSLCVETSLFCGSKDMWCRVRCHEWKLIGGNAVNRLRRWVTDVHWSVLSNPTYAVIVVCNFLYGISNCY